MPILDLRGIVPPVVTPLDPTSAEERVDEAALTSQLERLVAAGVHGLFFLGSTGEQPALRDAERRRAVRIAHRVVGGRIPLIVGTMAASTSRAIDNIQAAAEDGANAVAVTPPHYYPSRGAAEQVAHYEACARASPIPVVIYNIPSTTKVMVAPSTMARVAEIEGIVGIKDSSGDFVHFLRVLEAVAGRADFRVMIGTPPLAGAAVLAGGAGAVPGVANIDPATMLGVYRAARTGDREALGRLQPRVHRLMDIVQFGAPIVCIKTAMELMGLGPSRACLPLQPLDAGSREFVAAILRELGLLPGQ